MTLRIIKTLSSIWTLDETTKEFRRDPRADPDHPYVRYTGEWEKYDSAVDEFFEGLGTRTIIYFNEEHLVHGNWLLTGVHEEDLKMHTGGIT